MKYVPPSIAETAFNCPHCGVLTTQYWFALYASEMTKGSKPLIVKATDTRDWSLSNVEDAEKRRKFQALIEKMKEEVPFLWKGDRNLYDATEMHNVHASRCFECSEVTLWLNDVVLYPGTGDAPSPNLDLPEDVQRDYLEASSILNLSPRGAAALIRLAIQKLCKHLGEPGKDINTDIGALVAKGLDIRIQRALDVVRVVGNNAVHPGKIDITDDRATAESLFRLVNLIAEKMISEPKHVDEVYAMLPPGALQQIETRDKGKGSA